MSAYVHPKITILFGSQTGNSQDLAERIWRESKIYHFKSTVRSLDDYDVHSLLSDDCIIFICSTTGQGDVPDNMRKFWRFILRKSIPVGALSHLKYAVLGLGDSSYVKFNFTAKKLFKRLEQLGGTPITPIGLGDDQHDLGYDAVADPWITKLWQELLHTYPLPKGVKPLEQRNLFLPRYNVSKLLNNHAKVEVNQSIYYSTRTPSEFTVSVIDNKRTTDPSHFQDVRLIKFKTNGQLYRPGDVLVLRPKNLKWQIEEFENVLLSNNVLIEPETVLSIKQQNPEFQIPEVLRYNVTFSQLCEEYFDLMSIPRRYTFEVLSHLTDSELEKEKCLEFTTAEGQQDLYTYCNRPKRNIVEVLRDFPNATKNLTLNTLFELIPPIKPREFSIASSCQWHQNEIHILVAVVIYKTKLVKERFGLCSNFLANLRLGDEVTVWIKPGSFKFPMGDVPAIMVGPGTGVAPFRNYIFERIYKANTSKDLVLFFGCRNKTKDFFCEDDFQDLHDEKKLNLICAFSRDQNSKVYVQDKILEHKNDVWTLLQRNCYIFVAGNAKLMPQAVRSSFLEVCKDCGNLSEEEAEKFIGKMERENRYQTECWS